MTTKRLPPRLLLLTTGGISLLFAVAVTASPLRTDLAVERRGETGTALISKPPPRPERLLPPDADEATVLRYQLREEMLALREANAHLLPEERHDLLMAWREANEHRLQAALRSGAERGHAEDVKSAPPIQDLSGLPESHRRIFEERAAMRAERQAIAARFGPSQEEERNEALVAWREANEDRLQAARRPTESANDTERVEALTFPPDYTGLPEPQRRFFEGREAIRAERQAIAARFGPGEEEERHEALVAWRERNKTRFDDLRAAMQQSVNEEEQR